MTRRKVVFGIYNADGSFFGELRYSLSKVIGKGSCSLCDLTHGWNPFGKRQWKNGCKFSELDIQLIHRDEASESQLRAAGGLPSFITESEEGWIKILNADQIKELKGQPAELILRLESYFHEK